MKIKTSEAAGAALDWAVAKCEGRDLRGTSWRRIRDVPYGKYSPSTNWSQGGPIIEREKVGLLPSGTAYYERNGGTLYSYGPTPPDRSHASIRYIEVG